MGRLYGYVRVSTKEQNEERQLIALAGYDIPSANLYVEKQSGKDFCRPLYQRLLRRLRSGDILIVKSIDRLGRNYEEILEQWRRITKEIKADIVVADMPLLDTRRSSDLTGTLIADIVLQLLSYVAQQEREFIRQRQREGIDAARSKGVRFGRPCISPPGDMELWRQRYLSGQISARLAAEYLGVSHHTFLKWVKTPGHENEK